MAIGPEYGQAHRRQLAPRVLGRFDEVFDELIGGDDRGFIGAAEDGQPISASLDKLM